MANGFLFFQNRSYGLNNSETGLTILTFDLELAENHSFVNSVTQYNVEDGADISDHIQNNLQTGSISAFISNFSIFQNGVFSNRAQDAFDILEDLWKNKTLIDIYTVLKVYEGVAITNIDTSRDNGTGESIVFDISFQEFNRVKLQEIIAEVQINLPNMNTEQNRQSAPERNNGKTQGTIKTIRSGDLIPN